MMELKHYGVGADDNPPGRGSGRYARGSGDQPYQHGAKPIAPIEDTVLKKGTRLNTVSFVPNSETNRTPTNKRWMYTYNPKDEWDSKVYKGPFSYYKLMAGRAKIYEHQYEVVKDLKMPTSKERIDEFINLYTNNKKMVAKDMNFIQSRYKSALSEEAQRVKLKNLKTEDDYKAAYEIFNHNMEAVHMFKSTKKYADIMATKYDAMVDDNNQSIYNNVHDPIIVFKANKSLKTIGEAKYVDLKTIANNVNEVRNELTKQGKVTKF